MAHSNVRSRNPKAMTVKVVFEFSERNRQALSHHFGRAGFASEQDIRAWIEMTVNSTFQGIEYEYQQELDKN